MHMEVVGQFFVDSTFLLAQWVEFFFLCHAGAVSCVGGGDNIWAVGFLLWGKMVSGHRVVSNHLLDTIFISLVSRWERGSVLGIPGHDRWVLLRTLPVKMRAHSPD